jgi:glycosyltransferase involved in cell wall biosynthesis
MVIPSLWEEPFGIVALEGIACCDTIISSCRGGLPEAVGKCGVLLVPTSDNLTAAMLSVIEAKISGVLLPGQPSDEIRASHLAKHTPQAVTKKYLEVCIQASNKQ